MADQVTPFRFFATILGPDGGRHAFRARLGGEADDVLDTLLSQALAYEAIEPPSLQGFARFIRANESDIKREAEEASDRRARHDRARRQGARGGRRLPGRHRRRCGRAAASATCSSTIGKDARRPGLPLAAADGGSVRAAQRDADAVADDETRSASTCASSMSR